MLPVNGEDWFNRATGHKIKPTSGGKRNEHHDCRKNRNHHACFGTYPQTQALKSGQIKSDRVALRLTEVNPVYKAFVMMAREQKFDICEMALVTYLQAKAYSKPIVLMPAAMVGRFQHGTMLYNSERGTVTPQSLAGRRIGVRSFAQTTGCWMRGILWKDYGLDQLLM